MILIISVLVISWKNNEEEAKNSHSINQEQTRYKKNLLMTHLTLILKTKLRKKNVRKVMTILNQMESHKSDMTTLGMMSSNGMTRKSIKMIWLRKSHMQQVLRWDQEQAHQVDMTKSRRSITQWDQQQNT